jgi:hypothetical protein
MADQDPYAGSEPIGSATLAGAAGGDNLYPGSEPDQPGVLESFGRGALEGATFGFDNEIGLTDTAKTEASKKANPWAHFAGEIAGGILPMAAAGPAGAAIRGTGLAARGARAALSTLTPAKEINTIG